MIRSGLGILIAAAGLATDASAQLIRGRIVQDGSHEPIAFADVALLSENGRILQSARADSIGEFEFSLQSGIYAFRVDALGFVSVTTPTVELESQQELLVRIVLSPKVILLAPLEITARSRPLITDMMMRGFNERRAKNLGFAITRDQIEARKPRHVTDLLRMVPGVRVMPGGVGSASIEIPSAGTRFLGGCQVKVVLDGLLFRWGATTIDDIAVDDLEAIEVFRTLAETPAEFAGPDARCGVVAVWTKRGGR
jgi:hypothetical protein